MSFKAKGYTIEAFCGHCGHEIACDIEPDERVMLQCHRCEKRMEEEEKPPWPTKDVLLAVYGAPGKWPCEPADEAVAA